MFLSQTLLRRDAEIKIRLYVFSWYGNEVSFKLQLFYSNESESPVPQDEKTGGTQTSSKWIFSNLEQYTKNVLLFLVITASNPAVRVQFHRFFVKKKH